MMEQAINWKDDYSDTKYRKTLTAEYLNIPGLELFGKQIRTSATESLPLHFHEDCYEIVYITSGTPSFFVDGKTYNLSGGDVFITQPNQIHSTNSVPVTISEMYWVQVHVDPDFLYLNQSAICFYKKNSPTFPVPKSIPMEIRLKSCSIMHFKLLCRVHIPNLLHNTYLLRCI